MKKTLKTIIILSIIPLFVFSAIICCCFADKAEAQESMPSCHRVDESQQGNEADRQSAEDCDCVHRISLQAQKIVPVIQLAISASPDFKNILSLNSIASNISSDAALILAYQGPPQSAVHSSPIYIQNSNLRL